MTSSTDPIYMVQLINILGNEYVVWDKAASIQFKRPAKETIYVHFSFTEEEIANIKIDIAQHKEIDLIKELNIVNKEGSVVFAKLVKTIYIADKAYYKEKRIVKNQQKTTSA